MAVLTSSATVVAVFLVVALLVLALAVRSGWRHGGIAVLGRVAGALGGLVGGGVLAAIVLARSLHSASPVAHLALGVACALGGTLLGAAVGGGIGALVARLLPRLLDRVVGVVVRGGLAALVITLVLGLLAALGLAEGAVTASARPLGRGLIAGAGDLLARTGPDDVAALVPAVGTSAPSASTVRALDRDAAGSVFVLAASGCAGNVVGTAFVAGRGLVVTNAHVVHGADTLSVRTADGELAATPLVIDARADLAVLRVDGLTAATLPIASSDAANGTGAVIVGYPGGGPRRAVPAVVAQRVPVPGAGYESGVHLHDAYRLYAVVRHGNSGSPLLDTSGRVIGVVNASLTHAAAQGYAITASELRPDLARAAGAHAVDTGTC